MAEEVKLKKWELGGDYFVFYPELCPSKVFD
jgi:hypothetical protein